MTMLSPTMLARAEHAPASALSLWRWLLGGLVPLYAIVLTHNGFLPVWKKAALAIGMPAPVALLALPALIMPLVLLLSHLTNQYFIQGVGRFSIRRFLRSLLGSIPLLTLLLILGSLMAPLIVAIVWIVALVLIPIGLMLSPIVQLQIDLLVFLVGGTFLISGYLVGAWLPDIERLSLPYAVIDTDAMRRAHRHGGALAAGLLVSVPVAIGWLERGWSDTPWLSAAPLDQSIVLVALIVTAATLPHLLMTWRAVIAGPDVQILPLAEFVPRLVTVVFVIVALAAIEAVLLGGWA